MMVSGMILLGSVNTKFWYLVPLLVVISLVYGGTRHETLTQVIAHAIRSLIWLLVFWLLIFFAVWLSGFGTAADLLTPWSAQKLLSLIAWVCGALWITGHVFSRSSIQGLFCVLTGGISALLIGIKSCRTLWPANRATELTYEDQKDSADRSDPKNAELATEFPMPVPVVLMLAAVIWGAVALWMDR